MGKQRLSANPLVEATARKIGLENIENTALMAGGHAHDYIGNMTWNQALSLNLSLGGQTLNLRQFADFLILLKSGKARDGKGKEIHGKELLGIYDEITSVRGHFRSERLDARFEKKDGFLKINYNHSLNGGNLKPGREENLKDFLRKDKSPGINIDDWISSATYQGLPSLQTKEGNLFYWHPRDGMVAWFLAVSVRAYLDCYGGPASSDPVLGVREAYEVGRTARNLEGKR